MVKTFRKTQVGFDGIRESGLVGWDGGREKQVVGRRVQGLRKRNNCPPRRRNAPKPSPQLWGYFTPAVCFGRVNVPCLRMHAVPAKVEKQVHPEVQIAPKPDITMNAAVFHVAF